MQTERRSGNDERRILSAMATDLVVLSRLSGRWGEGLFSSKWANLVGGWCVKHFLKYEEVPGKKIRHWFTRWAERGPVDTEIVEAVEKFLAFMSREYDAGEKVSSEFVLDMASVLFNKTRLIALARFIEAEVEAGDIEEAAKAASEFGRLELANSDGYFPFADDSMLDAAFGEPEEALVTYPGALGQFFGTSMCRDSFVAFTAPEKRGKTWWLLDVAFRAALQKRKVAFFEVGDMSANQINRRWFCRVCKKPRKPGLVKVPKSMSIKGKEGIQVEFEEEYFNNFTGLATAREAITRLREKTKSDNKYLKVSVHPAASMSVDGIKSILEDWSQGGFVPDFVIVDYADLLAASAGAPRETRDQINHTWKLLRGLSQTLHCCVVTATQAKAESYTANELGMQHFSEDKRKLSHVTAMYGINANAVEKEWQVYRLNMIALREEEAPRPVYVAHCLKLGNPAVLSVWPEGPQAVEKQPNKNTNSV